MHPGHNWTLKEINYYSSSRGSNHRKSCMLASPGLFSCFWSQIHLPRDNTAHSGPKIATSTSNLKNVPTYTPTGQSDWSNSSAEFPLPRWLVCVKLTEFNHLTMTWLLCPFSARKIVRMESILKWCLPNGPLLNTLTESLTSCWSQLNHPLGHNINKWDRTVFKQGCFATLSESRVLVVKIEHVTPDRTGNNRLHSCPLNKSFFEIRHPTLEIWDSWRVKWDETCLQNLSL